MTFGIYHAAVSVAVGGVKLRFRQPNNAFEIPVRDSAQTNGLRYTDPGSCRV
jgi:hypothetical protein